MRFITPLLALFLNLLAGPGRADVQTEAALKQLRSPSTPVRISALRKLARLPPHVSASEPLLDALQDSAVEVRIAALKAWERMAIPYADLMARKQGYYHTRTSEEHRIADEKQQVWQKKLIERIAAQAEQEDRAVGRAAEHSLAFLGMSYRELFPHVDGICGNGREKWLDYKATSALQEIALRQPGRIFALLQDREPNVVYNAANALTCMEYAPVVPVLQQFLRHPRPEWRGIALLLLTARDVALERVLPLLTDRDDRVRVIAQITVRGRISDQEFPRLVAGYSTARPLLRLAILTRVREEMIAKYASMILTACHDENGDVRAEGLRLAHAGYLSVPEDYLITCLRHPSSRVRAQSLSFLAWTNRKRAKPYLLPMLNDADSRVAETAMSELLAMNVHDEESIGLVLAVAKAFRHSKKMENYALIDALAWRRPQIEALVRTLLSDRDWRMRVLATGAARVALEGEAVEALLRLSRDVQAEVRRQAVDELAKMDWQKDTRIDRAMMALLKDTSSDVRMSIVEAFSPREDPQAVAALRIMSEDEDSDVAFRAWTSIRFRPYSKQGP